MAQFLRPDSNVTQTSFTNGFAAIDEATASDADFAYGANNTAAVLEVGLSDPTTPGSGTCTVRYRIAKTNNGTVDGGGNAVTVTGAVYQGGSQVATDSARTATGTWTGYSFTFDTSAVSDWTDVRLRFTTSASGGSPANRRGGAVSWAEIEAPDAASAVTSTATWVQAAGSWDASATQSLDATAAFAQAAAAWEATATQRLDATASVVQAAAAWDAVAAAPITSQATFAQPAAGWLADVDVAGAGISSDATWEQAAAGWAAETGLHLDAAAQFTQAAGSWESSAAQGLDLAAAFTQASAGWVATAEAPVTSQATFTQPKAGWLASVDAGTPPIDDGPWVTHGVLHLGHRPTNHW